MKDDNKILGVRMLRSFLSRALFVKLRLVPNSKPFVVYVKGAQSKKSSQHIFNLYIHGYKMEFCLGRYLSSHSKSGFVYVSYFIF
jgi:hypothetical protein